MGSNGYPFPYGCQWISYSLHKDPNGFHITIWVLMDYPVDSPWILLDSPSIPFGFKCIPYRSPIDSINRFYLGSSAIHMDYIGCLIDSIWIPMDCQTDLQMDYNRFPVDFHLDSVGFNIEFQWIPRCTSGDHVPAGCVRPFSIEVVPWVDNIPFRFGHLLSFCVKN